VSKKMYSFKQYGFGIEVVEVVKESEKCVWLQQYTWGSPPKRIEGKSRRELKSYRNQFFDDFETAKAELMHRCRDNIERCKEQLYKEEGRLTEVSNMIDNLKVEGD
jgi:hypothetical protein